MKMAKVARQAIAALQQAQGELLQTKKETDTLKAQDDLAFKKKLGDIMKAEETKTAMEQEKAWKKRKEEKCKVEKERYDAAASKAEAQEVYRIQQVAMKR